MTGERLEPRVIPFGDYLDLKQSLERVMEQRDKLDDELFALRVALAAAETERDEANTILRWIAAGFPPWGCANCRGAEYGPDGVPCPECHGRSDLMEPPERARALETFIETVMSALRRERDDAHAALEAFAGPLYDATFRARLLRQGLSTAEMADYVQLVESLQARARAALPETTGA